MATREYKVSVYLAAIQPSGIELSDDRIHEGGKELSIKGTLVDGSHLMAALRDRIETYPGERNGLSYTIGLRTFGDAPPSMVDLGTVFFAETLEVLDTIYAEDLKQIIAEILGVEDE